MPAKASNSCVVMRINNFVLSCVIVNQTTNFNNNLPSPSIERIKILTTILYVNNYYTIDISCNQS